MKPEKYFEILTKEIHSVVVATVDDNGLPTTRVIDMMLYDEHGLYFLTAKGKAFYTQLMEKSYIALSAMTRGKGSMDKKALSISGAIRNIAHEKLNDIFAKNTYMADIYPTFESRQALEVFCIYKGQGEYFDLTTKPITRKSFAFGGQEVQNFGYLITSTCKECGECQKSCPSECITAGTPYTIHQENCLHCGNCYEACPNEAITKKS